MPGMSKQRIWAGGAGAIGLAAAVATLVGVSPTPSPISTPAAAAVELTPFDNCDQLRSWYVKTALPHVTAWGWDSGSGPVPLAYETPPLPTAAREDAGQADVDAVGNGATGTNVQEADVDEPDLAKTDGALVALVRRGDLVIFDATAGEPREIGRLELPDRLRVTELLLVGERAVLFGSSGGLVPYVMPMVDRGFGPYGGGPTRTSVTTVDLADPTEPALVRTEVVDGELVSAREHDGTVRVVTAWTPDFDFVYADGRLGIPEAVAKNRQIVRHAAAEEWLPSRRIDSAAKQPLLSCADVRHPQESAGLGTISVRTMDPDEPTAGSTTGLAADGNLLYASADRLYVATTDDGWTDWTWRPASDGDPARTDIHAFAVDDATTYVGSGDVPGRVPDRWAFSEHEGLLRVASTTGPAWRPRETRVTVLEEADGRLDPVGSVGGMGEGEQIESVRWFGDIAVVVTFRQVDPLYTLDLGDPTRPAVVGELKIPGFSAYLHPIGGDLLLGVGQDATMLGRLRGSQLSIFDLGELAAPDRVDTLGLGSSYASAVESAPRAFSYLPELRVAFVPTWSWRGGSTIEVAGIADHGRLGAVRSIDLPTGADTARVLPLDDGRVAIVAGGDVVAVADPARW